MVSVNTYTDQYSILNFFGTKQERKTLRYDGGGKKSHGLKNLRIN